MENDRPTTQEESQFQRMEKILWGSLDPTTAEDTREDEDAGEDQDKD